MLMSIRNRKIVQQLSSNQKMFSFHDICKSTTKRLRNFKGGSRRTIAYWINHRLYESEAKSLRLNNHECG